VAPQFREARLYTVAGFFGHRFGEGPRFVMLVLSLLFSVFIVAAQMAAFGTVLSAILPRFADAALVLKLAIITGGSMVIIYSTAGGLKAVIHTDVYQFIILFVGFLVTLALCLPDVTTFLAFLLGETFAPGYATRYCVGKTIRETKIGIAGVGFFLALTFPLIIFTVALYARRHFPDIDPQQALPMVVRELNNPVVAGLMIGALLMAVMSSADSALNSSSAIFVKDLFEHQLGWKDTPARPLLRTARVCTAALGVTAVAIAAVWSDIIQLLLFTYHIWAPAVILPVCVGAFCRERAREYSGPVMAAMLSAVGMSLVYKGLLALHARGIDGIFSPVVYSLLEKIDTSVFGVSVSVVVFFLSLPLAAKRRVRKESAS
jgi:SSS family solute:Na+ symporter